MGQIATAFSEAFRDYVTPGVPASGANEPSKAEIRAAFSVLDTVVAGISGGFTPYATKSAMDADTSKADGAIGYVYRNGGSAGDSQNGFYQWTGSAWERADWYESTITPALLETSAGTNRLDPTAIVVGSEVYTDGTLQPEAQSAASGLIYVRDWETLTVSGLPSNPDFNRFWAFYGPNGAAVVATGSEAGTATSFTLGCPAGAWFFRVSIYQRNATPGSYANAQAQEGSATTGFEAFEGGIAAQLGGIALPSVEIGVAGGRNLFDKGRVTLGQEVYVDGSLQPQADSACSAPIYVGHLRAAGIGRLTVSGLQAASFDRFWGFYSAPAATIGNFVAGGSIPATDSAATIAIPAAADWFIFSPKQRTAATPDFSAVQVEAGGWATAYQAFTPRAAALNGKRAGDLAPAPWTGGIGMAFGDSITETTDVDAGNHLYPTGYRANWPDYALPIIRPDAYYSYAKSGAHFASLAAGLTDNQKFEKQIDAAIADNHPARWIVVALGTNDFGNALGDYNTAMAKTLSIAGDGTVTTTLDKTVAIEAARLGFARIQHQWPDAKKLCLLPLQRAGVDLEALAAWVDVIARMAGRYGFTVGDQFRESGIVADFEVDGGAGRDLSDGTHPNAAGQRKQGERVAATLKALLV